MPPHKPKQIVLTEAPKKPRGRAAKGLPPTQKQLDALKPTQFKPGESGNPAGCPKGLGSRTISSAYKSYLESPMPDEDRIKLGLPEGFTWADAIAMQTQRRALGLIASDKLCFTAITELRETTEGKTPERQELTGRNGAPLPSAPPIVNVRFRDPADPPEESEKEHTSNAQEAASASIDAAAE